jgi:hypothetical protein
LKTKGNSKSTDFPDATKSCQRPLNHPQDDLNFIIGPGVNQDFIFQVQIGAGCGLWILRTAVRIAELHFVGGPHGHGNGRRLGFNIGIGDAGRYGVGWLESREVRSPLITSILSRGRAARNAHSFAKGANEWGHPAAQVRIGR